MEIKNYTLSKDYRELYDFICSGKEAYCLVDYDFHRDKKHAPHRDVCKCRRLYESTIYFNARGIDYGAVYPWDSENGTELDLFLRECKTINLEWIKP